MKYRKRRNPAYDLSKTRPAIETSEPEIHIRVSKSRRELEELFGVDILGGFLGVDEVTTTSDRDIKEKYYERTHSDGWTIGGEVECEMYSDPDCYIREFIAFHKKYGRVAGSFTFELFADSIEGLIHFARHHKPIDAGAEPIDAGDD